MADAKLTIAGMYNYQPRMFDELALPIVPTAEMLNIPEDMIISEAMQEIIEINLPDLIGKICLDSAGFSTLYMDADLMKILIGVWSRTRLPTWQRLYNTLFYKYNPIWNKNYYTDRSGEENGTKDYEYTDTADNRNTETSHNRSRDFGLTKGYDEGSVELSYEIQDLHPLRVPFKDTVSNYRASETDNTNTNGNNAQHILLKNSGNIIYPSTPNQGENDVESPDIAEATLNTTGATISENENGYIGQNNRSTAGVSKDKNTKSTEDTKHEYGNIGIMTTQQMLEAEQKLALFNIYEIISKEFIKKFCIMVY